MIVQPDIIQDMKKYMQLNKEYKDLEKIVVQYNQYSDALNHQQQAKELLEKEKDPDLRELAKEELTELEVKIAELDGILKEMLIPKDPNDDRNIFIKWKSRNKRKKILHYLVGFFIKKILAIN